MFSKGKYVVQRTALFGFDKLSQSFLIPIVLCPRKSFASKSKDRPKKVSPFLFQTKIGENNQTSKTKKEEDPTEWLELGLKEEISIEPKEENLETQQPTQKIKSEGVSWIKQDSNKRIGVDTRSIQLTKIQTLEDVIDFINQPQNMILTIRERNILYDKLVKIFSKPGLKVDSAVVKPALNDFLAKFLVSLKSSENHKLYLAIFNLAVPKELFIYCEDFFRECLNEILFNFPTLKLQVSVII